MESEGQIFSAWAGLNEALREAYVAILSGKPGAREAVLAVVVRLQRLIEADPDAALGLVHLLPPKPYATAHPLYCAVLTEHLATSLGSAPRERAPVLAATLTCNLASLPYQERLGLQRTALSREQQQHLRRHPDQAVTLLRTAGVASPTWLTIVKQHHERADGSGYPEGLKSDQILREAKLVALADMYLAQVTERAHRVRLAAKSALRQLFLEGQADDAELYATLIKALGVYPPGTGVRLANGEFALVLRRGASVATPWVRALRSGAGASYAHPPWRDTREPEFAVREAVAVPAALAPGLSGLWAGTGAESGNERSPAGSTVMLAPNKSS